jgi:hypothetical protein
VLRSSKIELLNIYLILHEYNAAWKGDIMDFVLLKDLNGYNDCSFDSKIITKIKKNTKMHKLYSNGPWIRSKYNDNLVWLYPFDKNKLIVNPTTTTEVKFDNNLKIGTVVYISPNQNNNLYKDRDNKLVEVIDKSERKKFFIIDSVKTIDEYYKVKSEDGIYYFVNESDINNILDEDSIKLVSNIFDLQLFADDSDDKTSNSNTEKSTISFGSYDTEIIEAYNTKAKIGSTINNAKINLANLRSVFGLPYQYLPDADLRLNSNGKSIENGNSSLLNVGMKYREKILARMPLLVMMPGVVNFMPNYSVNDQNAMISQLLNANGENYSNNKAFDFLMNKNTKTRSSYYTFYPAWAEYFTYVNTMCSAAAVFMGLSDVVLPYNSSTGRNSDTLATYKWQYATPSSLKDTFYRGSCAFYINTDTSINESYSNSTTQSQLASKVNSYSDMARELAFISGGATDAAAKIADLAATVGDKTIANAVGGANTIASTLSMGSATSKFKNQGLLHAILGGISNTATGAKMQFPELWQDSSFSRDYSVRIKLDSPDNDPLSIYLNIIVPLIHLTAFAAPRATGATTYASPFIVRAYYQGFFNVNMGIISSLSITKGAEGAWTLNNIPTVAEVEINIHDLFATQTISIDANNTESLWGLGMLSNQPLMEYIANMCGINYNEPDWDRLVDLAVMLMQRKSPSDMLTRIENNIVEAMQNYTPAIYNNVISNTDVSLFSIGYSAALSKATDYAKAKIFNVD